MPNELKSSNGTDLRERKVDLFTRSLKDFKGGRATNCGPSQSPTDYIIRSELDKALAGITKSTASNGNPTPAANTATATYILDVLGILYIQSSVTPRRYITATRIPTLIRFDVIGAPTGHSLDLEIYQDTVLYASASIPDGLSTYTLTSIELTAAGILNIGSYIRLDITAVGTTYRGDNLTVTILQ